MASWVVLSANENSHASDLSDEAKRPEKTDAVVRCAPDLLRPVFGYHPLLLPGAAAKTCRLIARDTQMQRNSHDPALYSSHMLIRLASKSTRDARKSPSHTTATLYPSSSLLASSVVVRFGPCPFAQSSTYPFWAYMPGNTPSHQ